MTVTASYKCPICRADRVKSETRDGIKVVYYDCGTYLKLKKTGIIYKGEFIYKCLMSKDAAKF